MMSICSCSDTMTMMVSDNDDSNSNVMMTGDNDDSSVTTAMMTRGVGAVAGTVVGYVSSVCVS